MTRPSLLSLIDLVGKDNPEGLATPLFARKTDDCQTLCPLACATYIFPNDNRSLSDHQISPASGFSKL
jgi:hypothetical protein